MLVSDSVIAQLVVTVAVYNNVLRRQTLLSAVIQWQWKEISVLNKALLNDVMAIARSAGDIILSVYQRSADFQVHIKGDDTPVTEADIAANDSITRALLSLTPNIPVLSEESGLPEFVVRRKWSRYWLVDPLDGTKEFIARNGEFTVNIALVEQGVPVLGVVYVPVTGAMYAGLQNEGAYRVIAGQLETISVRPLSDRGAKDLPIEVVTSRHHGADKVAGYCAQIQQVMGEVSYKPMGSSLKFCLIAEGGADLYPRSGPTSEWDTAAAQAIVEAAGGHVVDKTFSALRYNQKESIINPDFYVLGKDLSRWRQALELHV